MKARGYFDGSAIPNPGVIGAGAVIYDTNENEIDSVSIFVSEYGTVNEAEYNGLIALLERAKAIGVTDLEVFGDSQLVVRQCIGEYSVNAQNLQPLYQKVMLLSSGFQSIKINWIKRNENTRADALALDAVKRKVSKKVKLQSQNKNNKPKVKVKYIGSKRLLILIDANLFTVNLKLKTCTCGDYARANSCTHIQSLNEVLCPKVRV